MDRLKEVTDSLTDLLEDCLEYANQNGSFKVLDVDLKRGKFIVEFDIVEVPEDDYIGFQGY